MTGVSARAPDAYAAGVHRFLQKLVRWSLHAKRVAPSASVNLSQLLHNGWHPRGDVSLQKHSGGNFLLHAPQLSQQGHLPMSALGPPPAWLSARGRAASTATRANAMSSAWGFMVLVLFSQARIGGWQVSWK